MRLGHPHLKKKKGMGQRIGQKSHWEDEREVGRSQRKQKGGG
jgi:hypothetical protein